MAYELAHGPIPRGMVVRHKCDVRLCIAPNHLEVGTVLDNLNDMYSRGRNGQHKRRGEAHTDSKLTDDERPYIYGSPELGTVLSGKVRRLSFGNLKYPHGKERLHCGLSRRRFPSLTHSPPT